MTIICAEYVAALGRARAMPSLAAHTLPRRYVTACFSYVVYVAYAYGVMRMRLNATRQK